ncbi:MAG: exopolyphosphatase / guanosine-5-triphosphate,3-diphosphate pyrophosphatase [Clostridia bacterium]|nr:exopolyphosphatase / guanosine-5-triphosphate,3-diphosphate pyrophosphatase [Clostridia bacterium]
MPIYAAVDIGSNSVRLLVAEYIKGKIKPLKTGLISTRLAAGASEGYLQAEAIARTVAAVRELLDLALIYRPQGISLVATSAVREARNQKAFQRALWEATGREAVVLSGSEEARLGFYGALAGLPVLVDRPAVFDLGGGSTEFTWQQGSELKTYSVPIGAVRCTEEDWELKRLQEILKPVLTELRLFRPSLLIGTGGTVTTLAALDQKLDVYDSRRTHGYLLTWQAVTAWLAKLTNASLAERRRMPGLQPERADIIVAGVRILAVIMAGLELNSITVSESDLLWGLILTAAGEGDQI